MEVKSTAESLHVWPLQNFAGDICRVNSSFNDESKGKQRSLYWICNLNPLGFQMWIQPFTLQQENSSKLWGFYLLIGRVSFDTSILPFPFRQQKKLHVSCRDVLIRGFCSHLQHLLISLISKAYINPVKHKIKGIIG